MDAIDSTKICIVILAAGASRRFGSPKQIYPINDKSLIRHVSETAVSTGLKTVVVLGANFNLVKNEIENLPLTTAFNAEWEKGMSSSIKCGLKKMLAIAPEVSAIVLVLGDQPLVTRETIYRLIKTMQKTKKPVVASEYENAAGVPAIFAREMFDELMNLQGETGARRLIKKYAASSAKIRAPEAAFDIDSPSDILNLKDYIF